MAALNMHTPPKMNPYMSFGAHAAFGSAVLGNGQAAYGLGLKMKIPSVKQLVVCINEDGKPRVIDADTGITLPFPVSDLPPGRYKVETYETFGMTVGHADVSANGAVSFGLPKDLLPPVGIEPDVAPARGLRH